MSQFPRDYSPTRYATYPRNRRTPAHTIQEIALRMRWDGPATAGSLATHLNCIEVELVHEAAMQFTNKTGEWPYVNVEDDDGSGYSTQCLTGEACNWIAGYIATTPRED